MIRLALLGLVVLLAGGCWQSQTRTAYQASGTIDGKAVSLTVNGAEASDAGVDPLSAIQGALAAMRGDLAGVSAAIAAQPPPPPAVEPAAIAAAVIQATPKAAPPPATLTGSAIADTAAAALLAYLTGKGGIALGRKLKPTKATP